MDVHSFGDLLLFKSFITGKKKKRKEKGIKKKIVLFFLFFVPFFFPFSKFFFKFLLKIIIEILEDSKKKNSFFDFTSYYFVAFASGFAWSLTGRSLCAVDVDAS